MSQSVVINPKNINKSNFKTNSLIYHNELIRHKFVIYYHIAEQKALVINLSCLIKNVILIIN